MSAVVGIDLGTTNTVVAAVREGRAITLASAKGERLLPSVVSFQPSGSVLVGREAKERRLQDAAHTVYSIKRLIGRTWDSSEVQKAAARVPFQMKEGPGRGVLVSARNETFTLSEISAFVLREAKAIAEAVLQEPVDRAVVTVPANFNDLQRAATKVSAHIAGIEVLRIVNEPTAAALAYGYGRGTSERIAVYDFGGGTFDLTLLDLAGNVFEVLATAGDTFLGGDDIDAAIAERIAEQFLKTHRYDPRADRQVFERCLAAAEQVKIGLSSQETVIVPLRELAHGAGGRALNMDFIMRRSDFELLIRPLVDRTMSVCEQALKTAGLKPSDFDQVILVGGSTRMPLVKRRVAELFGRKPLDTMSPDEVVALGAAIQAAALTGAERRRNPAPVVQVGAHAGSAVGVIPQRGATARGSHPGPVDVVSALPAPPPPGAPSRNAPPPPPFTKAPAVAALVSPTLQPVIEHNEHMSAPSLQVDTSTPYVPRVLAEDPTELRSATQLVREMAKAQAASSAVGVTTAPMPASPAAQAGRRGAPPPPPIRPGAGALPPAVAAGQTTARMPSAPAITVGPAVPISIPAAAPVPRVAPTPAPPTVAPLLLDVTPLSLAVETVGGYCDVIIEKNTPVPCERTRLFTTATDDQEWVRVNVAQGESDRFAQNTLLGQLELTGLRPAPRGQLQIAVTFEIDSDGLLDVRAEDKSTGLQTSARIHLGGAIPQGADIEAARQRMQGR